jgi:hypothetical protein
LSPSDPATGAPLSGPEDDRSLARGDGPEDTDGGPKRRRIRPGLIVALVLVVVVAWAAWCALSLVRAAGALQRGSDAINQVRGQLNPDALTNETAVPPLNTAASEFGRAHSLTSGFELAPLRILPVVGRQLRSVDALGAAAARVSHVGVDAIHQAHLILSAKSATPEDRLALLRRLAVVADQAHTQLTAVSLGPSKGLIGTLSSRRAQFSSDLTRAVNGLSQARAATNAMLDLLGNKRNYVVLAANNAEMRAGSGMILQAGVITTDGSGKFSLGSIGSTADLLIPPPGVPMSGDLADRWGYFRPNEEWRNLGLTPRFDANAELAARMWQAKTGQHVDGALAMDVDALKSVLSATGPVEAGGTMVSAATVEQYLLHDQYQAVPDFDTQAQAQRRDKLGALAFATLDAAENANVDLVHLAPALAEAVAGRHILAWSSTPAIEQDWVDSGVAGLLGPSDVLLAVANRGANKLDPFLAVSATMTLHPDATGTDVEVAVTLRNATPPGQPRYVTGPGTEEAAPGDYEGFVGLDFPGRAGKDSVAGNLPVVSAGRDGPNSLVLSTQVVVKPGASGQVTFRFRLSGSHGELKVQASARIPPTTWQVQGQSFTDATPHTVSW